MTEFINVNVDSEGLHAVFGWKSIIILAVVILFFHCISLFRNRSYLPDEIEVGTDGVKKKYKFNIYDLQVGYMFWVEMTTRKIGLVFDEENDVISEVYDSWYEFFKIARLHIKEIPVEKIRGNKTTQQVVSYTVMILNDDLRLHLTKWQARYRRWWNSALQDPSNTNLTPQQIQKKYPDFECLVREIKVVNAKMIDYRSGLQKLYIGE